VTGPVRFSSAAPAAAGIPRLFASAGGSVLALFLEGGDLKARLSHVSVFGQPLSGSPAGLEGDDGAVGAFDAEADGMGDFHVVFDQAEAAGGRSVKLRRTLWSVWQAGPVYASPEGSSSTSFDAPRIRVASSGRSLILFRAQNALAVPADRSLMAVAYDPASTPPLFSSWASIDLDGTTPGRQDIADYSLVIAPSSGRGFAFFRQDAESGTPERVRLFARAFDLGNFGSSTPVFAGAILDVGEGSGATQTETPLFDVATGPGGKGFLVHVERVAGSPAGTAHLFARAIDAGAFGLGQVETASRGMNSETGTFSNEGVDAARVLLAARGKAFLLHTVSQTDSAAPTTYRRLFANVVR
jgi:hypothetical protein